MTNSSSSGSATSGRGIPGDTKTTYLGDLPKNYDDTKIVLLPRDPFWAYAYWEISTDTRRELNNKYGTTVKFAIRVYDVTDINFDGKNSHKAFDIIVGEAAENWYINMPDVNRSWCVDLGLILADGRFITIARSNVVSMPHHGISTVIDEQWAILHKDFERLIKLSGIEKIGKSSFDITKLMRERWEQLMSISSGQMPSSHVSSLRKAGVPAEKIKSFWLKADTELIVYGTTESDAKLTISGKEVKLNSDGSFSVRMHLPDCEMNIPIKAVSKDTTMSKEITFEVKRSSFTDENKKRS
ncbi:MAG: DUF4912 domain-containing protein [Elusimicrobiota bacterium]